MNAEILNAIQCYTARSAITSSSMRGAVAGTIPAARGFLSDLPLGPFGTARRLSFAANLDGATDKLLRTLPKKARHWGRARKGLNIFLRGCLYTSYLRDEYGLAQAEEYFEIPLDSITGARLVEESGEPLPRWTTVSGLDSKANAEYQAAAAKLAAQDGIAKVHLDALWWGKRD